MRRPRRRRIAPWLLALAVIGMATASSSHLVAASVRSQIVQGGGPCTLDALVVHYQTSFRPGGHVVDRAHVEGLPAECSGAELQVRLSSTSADPQLALSAAPRPVFSVGTDGKGTVLFDPALLIAPLVRVDVGLTSRRVPIPAECERLAASFQRVITGTTAGDRIQANDRENALIYGLGGDDAVYGRDGIDCVVGGPGDDIVSGGDRNGNAVLGQEGRDDVLGGNGDDLLHGGAGADRIVGNDGNDTLYGDAGADTLLGGNGNDVLYVDALDVLADGGTGKNTCFVQPGTRSVVRNCGTVKTW